MSHTTLFMRVGRNPRQPLCSVDNNADNAQTVLSAHEVSAMSAQISAGVAHERVSFERETGGKSETAAPKKVKK